MAPRPGAASSASAPARGRTRWASARTLPPARAAKDQAASERVHRHNAPRPPTFERHHAATPSPEPVSDDVDALLFRVEVSDDADDAVCPVLLTDFLGIAMAGMDVDAAAGVKGVPTKPRRAPRAYTSPLVASAEASASSGTDSQLQSLAILNPSGRLSPSFLNNVAGASMKQADTVVAGWPAPPSAAKLVKAQWRGDRPPMRRTASDHAVPLSAGAGAGAATAGRDQPYLDPPTTSPDVRPNITYASLIQQAIESSPNKQCTLNDIYRFIQTRHAYYRNCKNNFWKNSIRHNLTALKYFVKVPRSDDGYYKSTIWAIDRDALQAMQAERAAPRPFLNSAASSPMLSSRSSPAMPPLAAPAATNVTAAANTTAGFAAGGRSAGAPAGHAPSDPPCASCLAAATAAAAAAQQQQQHQRAAAMAAAGAATYNSLHHAHHLPADAGPNAFDELFLTLDDDDHGSDPSESYMTLADLPHDGAEGPHPIAAAPAGALHRRRDGSTVPPLAVPGTGTATAPPTMPAATEFTGAPSAASFLLLTSPRTPMSAMGGLDASSLSMHFGLFSPRPNPLATEPLMSWALMSPRQTPATAAFGFDEMTAQGHGGLLTTGATTTVAAGTKTAAMQAARDDTPPSATLRSPEVDSVVPDQANMR